VDNPNNTRCEVSRYFKKKEREHWIDKVHELAKNSKNKFCVEAG
jgi:hypothetical protein